MSMKSSDEASLNISECRKKADLLCGKTGYPVDTAMGGLWSIIRSIVWGPHDGAIHYHLYDDTTGRARVIGPGILTENGHMTYSRDRRWILSDTDPDANTNERILFLFDTQTDTRHDLGSFYTPPDLGTHNRCDLHPRWSHDNTQVCIDTVHEGTRQMYLLDVTDIVSE